MTRRLTAYALAVAIALGGAGAARADGDPASDVLYSGRVFFPYATSISTSSQDELTRTIESAEKTGYPIRVALIAQQSDLGAVTSLWGKPKTYARFLSLELSFIYTGPLLIVMPSGIGFAHYKHDTRADYRALSTVPVVGGSDGLAKTAVAAITVLAAGAGYTVTPSSSSSHTALVTWLAPAIAFVLIAAAAGALVTLRRRRTRP